MSYVKPPYGRVRPFAWSNPMESVVSPGQYAIHFPSLYPMGNKNLAPFLPFWLQPSALPPGFFAFQIITKSYQYLLQFSIAKRLLNPLKYFFLFLRVLTGPRRRQWEVDM